jgi:hypothetical protein
VQLDAIVAHRRLASGLAQRRHPDLMAAPAQLGAEILDYPLLAADDRREGLRQHQDPH